MDGGDRVRAADIPWADTLARTLTGHSVIWGGFNGGVRGGGIQSHRRLLAAAGTDNMVRLWNPATGEHIRTLTGHTKEISGGSVKPRRIPARLRGVGPGSAVVVLSETERPVMRG